MTFLLDTCTFLWLADDSNQLSSRAQEILENSSHTLRLHQISSLEIQIKFGLGKLPLPHLPRIAVSKAIEAYGLDYRTLDDNTIYSLEKLPPLHRDPFDRLLIAHALYEGLPIITPDPLIDQYPVRTIW